MTIDARRICLTPGALLHFYCKDRLVTEVNTTISTSLLRIGHQALAQRDVASTESTTTLFSTDQRLSLQNIQTYGKPLRGVSYTPYGYCLPTLSSPAILGFNGERPERQSANYLLGNGHRMFSPTLRRFCSSDRMSPFGAGGLNSYAYCLGDPVNLYDPDGSAPVNWKITSAKELYGEGARHSNRTRQLGDFELNIFNFRSTISRTGQKFRSTPSLKAQPADDEITKHWDLIGFHGSKTTNRASLERGLDPKLTNPRGKLEFGHGFYSAPIRSSPFGGKDSHYFGVYTENFDRLKLGRDYDFSPQGGMGFTRGSIQVVVREIAYSAVAVRANPEGAALFPRSKEAPF